MVQDMICPHFVRPALAVTVQVVTVSHDILQATPLTQPSVQVIWMAAGQEASPGVPAAVHNSRGVLGMARL